MGFIMWLWEKLPVRTNESLCSVQVISFDANLSYYLDSYRHDLAWAHGNTSYHTMERPTGRAGGALKTYTVTITLCLEHRLNGWLLQ